MQRSPTFLSGLLTLVFAISLVFAAFAHKPVAIASGYAGSSSQIEATLLPGESINSVCINSSGDGHSASGGPCRFCTLAHGMLLNCQAFEFQPTGWHIEAKSPERFAVLVTTAYRPWAPANGPPVFS